MAEPIPPAGVSAERIIAAADALRSFASAFLDVAEDDTSRRERERLSEAAELMESALERFE
jgi:hypothetical protein